MSVWACKPVTTSMQSYAAIKIDGNLLMQAIFNHTEEFILCVDESANEVHCSPCQIHLQMLHCAIILTGMFV